MYVKQQEKFDLSTERVLSRRKQRFPVSNSDHRHVSAQHRTFIRPPIRHIVFPVAVDVCTPVNIIHTVSAID